MNQYELTKSNRFGYGSVFAPEYRNNTNVAGLAEPSGRFGCLVLGTRPAPGTIESTYCNIYESSNKAASNLFPYAPFSESYEYADIASVFNLYINGVRNGECPEYFAYKNDRSKNKVPVDSSAVVTYIVQRLPELSKYTKPDEFVRFMFYIAGDLYRQDIKYVRPDVLWPATIDSRKPGNPEMDDYYDRQQKESEDKGSIFTGVNDLLSNLLTVVVIGGAIYFLLPVFSSKR